MTEQVVSLEGLDRLVLELQNATVGRSLHMCLQTALLAPPSTLVIAVQTCLLEHNVVGGCSRSITATPNTPVLAATKCTFAQASMMTGPEKRGLSHTRITCNHCKRR